MSTKVEKKHLSVVFEGLNSRLCDNNNVFSMTWNSNQRSWQEVFSEREFCLFCHIMIIIILPHYKQIYARVKLNYHGVLCIWEFWICITILIGEQSTEKWNKHLAENIGKIVGKSLNIRKINSFILSYLWVSPAMSTNL